MIEVLGKVKTRVVEAVLDNGVVGGVISPGVPRAGWYVALLSECLSPAMEPYLDTSGEVQHVLYGRDGDTLILRFPDEATGRSALGLPA